MRFFGAFNSRFSVNVYASATVSGDVSPNSRMLLCHPVGWYKADS